MVIGEYNGDYYRGRVTKIKGEMYRVDFVDFGGAREMPYTELYPVSENIMTVITSTLVKTVVQYLTINVT